MEITLMELKEKLAEQVDEISLLELLEINSYDIVDRFEDLIEANFNKLIKEVDFGDPEEE